VVAVMTAHRWVALAIALASGGAMLYVGLYQSRAIRRLWCPLFGGGCEKVADAPFARPFGVPDGYIAAGLYALIALLCIFATDAVWNRPALIVLTILATIGNVIGVSDMSRLGAFCAYCLATALLSPVLLWAVWTINSV
jgi:uncharacterized membrane protein